MRKVSLCLLKHIDTTPCSVCKERASPVISKEINAGARQAIEERSKRNNLRRTKIVATVGPATDDPKVLKELIQAGATTLRLNFSHGIHEDHRKRISLIRQISFELNQPVAILQDLQGPKIRLGKFETPIDLKVGDPYILTSREVECGPEVGWISYDRLAEEVPVGSAILLDDGKVEMHVESIDLVHKNLHCVTVCPGRLSSNKGVNFPNVSLSVRALTDKDREDLIFGLNQGVDWVALSFVREASDVYELKELIAQQKKRVPVIVKIEKFEAIQNIDSILAAADGLMVARGDLGVEMPAEEVPILQKLLIRMANGAGKPVITATQMLDSMVNNPRPTRAEVSDVANAILDGTDAVMLSNETAVGSFPVNAVETMVRIALQIEHKLPQRSQVTPGHSITDAIANAVAGVADQLSAAAIVTLTKSGATARNVSKFRPANSILAVTPLTEVARQLQLVWGVRPLLVLDLPSTRQTFQAAVSVALEEGLLQQGDLVVMTAGTLTGISGSTDLLKVEIVTTMLGQGTPVGRGTVSGRSRVFKAGSTVDDVAKGDILVASQTNADYIEAIKNAGGIIVEEEGFTSHAAVVGLRLGVPVLLGVRGCTQIIADGIIITLDSQRGVVYSGSTGKAGDF
jgi:pyruvate kinase